MAIGSSVVSLINKAACSPKVLMGQLARRYQDTAGLPPGQSSIGECARIPSRHYPSPNQTVTSQLIVFSRTRRRWLAMPGLTVKEGPFPFPIERKGTERSCRAPTRPIIQWGTTPAKPGGSGVPGVDFGRVRALVTMEQVLSLLGFEPSSRSGSQWYGSCPLHESGPGRRHRCFSVNVALGRYYCHAAGVAGISSSCGRPPRGCLCINWRSTCVVGWAATFPGYSGGDRPRKTEPRASRAWRHRNRRKREEATGTRSIRPIDHRLS
jgi:hypothetical protein